MGSPHVPFLHNSVLKPAARSKKDVCVRGRWGPTVAERASALGRQRAVPGRGCPSTGESKAVQVHRPGAEDPVNKCAE